MTQPRHYINGFTLTVPAGGIGKAAPLQMPRDGFDVSFEQIGITAVNDAGQIVDANGLFNLDTQGGQMNSTLFTGEQHMRNLAGNGALPWLLPTPWRVPGNLQIGCTVKNLSAANVTFYISLIGKQVAPAAGPKR